MAMTKACPECGQSLHHLALKCRCGWADKSAKQSNDDGRPRGSCSAYGCILGGTIFNTTGPGGEGWCAMHARHSERGIQEVTRAIQPRAELFQAARRMLADVSNVDFWRREIPASYGRPFRDAGRLDLLPTDADREKTLEHWYGRVFQVLEIESLASIGVSVKPLPATTLGPAPRPFAMSPEEIADMREAEAEIATRSAEVL